MLQEDVQPDCDIPRSTLLVLRMSGPSFRVLGYIAAGRFRTLALKMGALQPNILWVEPTIPRWCIEIRKEVAWDLVAVRAVELILMPEKNRQLLMRATLWSTVAATSSIHAVQDLADVTPGELIVVLEHRTELEPKAVHMLTERTNRSGFVGSQTVYKHDPARRQTERHDLRLAPQSSRKVDQDAKAERPRSAGRHLFANVRRRGKEPNLRPNSRHLSQSAQSSRKIDREGEAARVMPWTPHRATRISC